jgi:cytochrome oxidase assembly protein ShyY1
MFRVAVRPRFLGLLALMVAATVVCGLLASWQWDRAHRALEAKVVSAENQGPIQDVLDLGSPVTNELDGATVEATGTFGADEQVVIPQRNIAGTDAVIVVTALHVTQADGTVARLPVARGWIPADEVIGADGTVDPSAVPAPPSGEVTITGRLEASEAASGGVQDGIAHEIATPLLVNVWGEPMYAGFLADSAPADGLQPLPEAQSEFSRGLDWQNLGYAAQWILFGGFFLYLWFRSVRSTYLDERAEAREALEAELAAAQNTTTGATDPDTRDKD